MQYSILGIHKLPKDLRLRILGNQTKISNLGGHIAWCTVSFQEIRLSQQQSKNTQKQIPNFFFSVQFYWISPFFFQIFVRDCKLPSMLYSIMQSILDYLKGLCAFSSLVDGVFTNLLKHFVSILERPYQQNSTKI